MKIAICSDMHLDIAQWNNPEWPEADVLVIAGDSFEARLLWTTEVSSLYPLGQYCRWFLNEAKKRYKDVVMVAGNHEYYGSSIEKVDKYLSGLQGIHFLQNRSVVIQGQLFHGGTYWTDMGSEVDRFAIRTGMNDFKKITYKNRRFKPVDAAIMHASALSATPREGAVIVMHHAPNYKSIKDYWLQHPCSPAYASKVFDHFDNPLIIHGHTHDPVDYRIGNSRVFSNPKGYGCDFKIKVLALN